MTCHDTAACAAAYRGVGHVGCLVRAPPKSNLDRPVLTTSDVDGDVCTAAVPSGYDLIADACTAAVDLAVCGDDSWLEVDIAGEVCGRGVLFSKDILTVLQIAKHPRIRCQS